MAKITEIGLSAKLNLRSKKPLGSLGSQIKKLIGVAFPPKPLRFTHAKNRRIIWLAPDEFLVLAEDGVSGDIIKKCTSPDIALTDVSDAFGGITLEGKHSRDILAKHCSLDFHPEYFTKGMAQRSLLAHATVIILCTDKNSFEIIGQTSFMPYIRDLMHDAAIEFNSL